MVIANKVYTVEEFEAFLEHPDNADRLFELIDGQIFPVVSNNRSSEIGLFIGALLLTFVMKHKLGRVTGADGGYIVSSQRYIPDVAYISRTRQPESNRDAYNPQAPDLAVEVLSPTDKPSKIRVKVVSYLQAGVTVWVIDPDEEVVEVYKPNQTPVTLKTGDVLTDDDLLPDFALGVQDIFEL